jgi:hypothetical protein
LAGESMSRPTTTSIALYVATGLVLFTKETWPREVPECVKQYQYVVQRLRTRAIWT